MVLPLQLQAVIQEINDNQIKLAINDPALPSALSDQTLVLPKRLLPADTKVGDQFVLELLTKQQSDQTKEQLNRLLLEELLNG